MESDKAHVMFWSIFGTVIFGKGGTDIVCPRQAQRLAAWLGEPPANDNFSVSNNPDSPLEVG